MSRSRRTIRRESVFGRQEGQSEELEQGLDIDEQPSRQTAVWLTDREINWLDDRCQEMKRSGWRGVTRSAMIRAVIRASMANETLDLEGVAGESELVDRLVE